MLSTHSPLVAGYFGVFDDAYEETIKMSDNIPWNYTNRVYTAFATLDNEGNLINIDAQSEERIKKIIALFREANPGGDVFITSNFDGDMDNRYLQAAKNPKKFAEGVLNYLQKYDLDGYDMDWETGYINNYATELKNLLQACYDLFQQIGLNYRGKKYRVTHTIFPAVHSPELVAGLSSTVDEINIMSYDLDSPEDLVNEYHEKGFPYEKMLVGVLSETKNQGMEESILKKIEVVKKYHLGGIYSWRLDNDLREIDPKTSQYGPSTFRIAKLIQDSI